MKITSGLFDIQVNGFAGIDFNDENITATQLDIALEAMLKTGVTACLPTIITASESTLIKRFLALDKAINESQLGHIMIPGYHLEGPFLNSADGYAGCHPPSVMATPHIALINKLETLLSKPILLVTYAPEFDDGFQFASKITQMGKRLAIGHSNADHQTLKSAIKAGLSLSTHLGNGVPQQLHKLDNTIQAQLSYDQLYASFIADGLHIPVFALKNLLRAKTFERAILVTDAVSAAACQQSGMYPFADMLVERINDGTVRVPGATNLAGSSLTLDCAIRNLVNWHITSFEQAIKMAADNPKQFMQSCLQHHQQTLLPSEVTWNSDYQVVACKIDSKVIRQYCH